MAKGPYAGPALGQAHDILERGTFHVDGKGINVDGYGYIRAWGTTVPTDGATGYAFSCIYHHTDGVGPGDVKYVNIGDKDSANFNAWTTRTDASPSSSPSESPSPGP